jgi:Spy/CpxP family protein refolding chaperone
MSNHTRMRASCRSHGNSPGRGRHGWVWKLAPLTLAGLLALGGTALAQPGGDHRGSDAPQGPPAGPHGMPGGPRGPMGPPPGPHLPPPEVLDQLGLSDAQRDRLDDLREAEMRKMIRAEADVRIAEMDLHQLTDQDHPDHGAIDAAIDRVSELRSAMLKQHVETYLAMRSVLSADQRAKLRRLGPPPRPR